MSAKRKAVDATLSSAKKARSITSFFTPTPGSSSSSSGTGKSSPAVRFDKAKWVAGLNKEQKELLQLEINTMHESWLGALKDEIVTPEFLGLKRFLKAEKEKGKTVFPEEGDIYSWTTYTPLDTVKIVILGQDPYHGPNQAHGLSFSVRPPTPAPPSLQNIYKALKTDFPTFKPPPSRGGLLTPWAKQGVLMLNACLTVRAHEANSHSNKGWEKLTQRAIDVVAQRRMSGVVFMVWGKPAEKRVTRVDKERHCVLTSAHPSPLSARHGFFTCAHFKKANLWLADRYGVENGPIDWNLGGGAPALLVAGQPQPKKKAPVVVAAAAAVAKKKMNEDVEVDEDEEEAMVAAAMEFEEQQLQQQLQQEQQNWKATKEKEKEEAVKKTQKTTEEKEEVKKASDEVVEEEDKDERVEINPLQVEEVNKKEDDETKVVEEVKKVNDEVVEEKKAEEEEVEEVETKTTLQVEDGDGNEDKAVEDEGKVVEEVKENANEESNTKEE